MMDGGRNKWATTVNWPGTFEPIIRSSDVGRVWHLGLSEMINHSGHRSFTMFDRKTGQGSGVQIGIPVAVLFKSFGFL